MNDIAHYINGSAASGTSSRTQPVYNPATGDSEKNVVLASTADVDTAVAAAKAAWPSWSKTPPLRRARILDRFKSILWERTDELASILASEHGKTHDDALGEVTRGLEVVEFAIGAPSFLKGDFSEKASASGRDSRNHPSVPGRLCWYYAVQLSCDGTDVDVSGFSGVWQHVRNPAIGACYLRLSQTGRVADRTGLPDGVFYVEERPKEL